MYLLLDRSMRAENRHVARKATVESTVERNGSGIRYRS